MLKSHMFAWAIFKVKAVYPVELLFGNLRDVVDLDAECFLEYVAWNVAFEGAFESLHSAYGGVPTDQKL